MRCLLIPVRVVLFKRQEIISIGRRMKIKEPCTLVVGMWICVTIVENSMEGSKEIKNRATTWPSYFSAEYYPKKMKLSPPKDM
jgi:hypothetical protein